MRLQLSEVMYQDSRSSYKLLVSGREMLLLLQPIIRSFPTLLLKNPQEHFLKLTTIINIPSVLAFISN